jgi:UDP:flavonoid glycosyltransferase YjiC (YdhE family)
MQLTVFAAGSRGDIQPSLALNCALQATGYQVRRAAPADFAAFIQQHGSECHLLRGDVQALMAGDTGKRFMEAGSANPLHALRAMWTMLAPVIGPMAQSVYEACREAEALICLGVFGAFGQSICRRPSGVSQGVGQLSPSATHGRDRG